MTRFPLVIYCGDMTAALTPAKLTRLLSENKTIWARVGPDSSVEPYVRPLDYVQLAAGDSSRALSIVEIDGQTALAVGRSADKPLAKIRRVCRASASPRYWLSTADLPWRLLLRSGNMSGPFLLADKAARLWSQVVWVIRQLRPLPDPEDMAAMVRGFYDQPGVVDEYIEGAALGLREEERKVVARYLHKGNHILDIGCGAGREAFGFAQLGFTVTAVDISPGMIARAAQHPNTLAPGGRVRFLCTSGSPLDLPNDSFDAVYISPGILSSIPKRRNRVSLLERCGNLVKRGGMIMSSNVVSPRHPSRRERMVVEGARWIARWVLGDRTPEPGDRWRHYTESPEEGVPLFFHHDYYHEREIREEIQEAGLRVIDEVSGFFVLAPEP